MLYSKRYIASILIEASTPLNISSGEKNILTDSVIITDANGLPMIAGTSITGVLRSGILIDSKLKDAIFGFQEEKRDDGLGSRIIVSNGHFVGKHSKTIEGLDKIDWNDDFYRKFKYLPIRQHTKISDKGAAEDYGKFDEQVVYKGTRFRFELELIGNSDDDNNWNKILNHLNNADFRIGGGSRKGFGEIKIIDIKHRCFDLKLELDKYLEKTSSLNNLSHLTNFTLNKENNLTNWVQYKLKIEPEDLWLFSSGLSDDEADIIPVYEDEIQWKDNESPEFTKDKRLLIPASSIKGAISHRTAYYHNKLCKKFADKLLKNQREDIICEKNDAVKALFGYALDNDRDKNQCDNKDQEKCDNKNKGQRGNVIFSDFFMETKESLKILNHVTIDRFTGGTIDGALFDEKVVNDAQEITFTFSVLRSVLQDNTIKESLELTLNDICSGMLPLGGGVMRGHGCFKGQWEKINE